MKNDICKVCGGVFHLGTLKDSKCVVCAAQYPNANSMDEVMEQKGNKDHIHTNLTENRVKEIVYGILNDAGMSRKKCEICSEMFWPRSPAQKRCTKCAEKKTDDK